MDHARRRLRGLRLGYGSRGRGLLLLVRLLVLGLGLVDVVLRDPGAGILREHKKDVMMTSSADRPTLLLNLEDFLLSDSMLYSFCISYTKSYLWV